MSTHDGYETIKLIERGGKCHIVMDYVRGDPLIYWLRYHPNISKAQLFLWMEEIIRQMEQYHRSIQGACYRYLNPYSIIVSKDERLMLLDLEAESNEEIVRNMQKQVIRLNFSPSSKGYHNKLETDLYCLGKTLQFLLAQTDTDPRLTRTEERKLSKIIRRLIDTDAKQPYQNFKAILDDIPKQKQMKQKKTLHAYSKWILGAVAALVMVIAILQPFRGTQGKSRVEAAQKSQEKVSSADQKESKKQGADAKEEQKLYMEMGLVQFVDLCDYQKSKVYFGKINQHYPMASYYIQLANYMLGNSKDAGERQVEENLKQLKKIIQSEEDDHWQEHYVALLRVYATLESQHASEEILKLGEQLNRSSRWVKENEEQVLEVKSEMAAAYHTLDQKEEAVKYYEDVKEHSQDPERVEAVCTSLMHLYKEQNQMEQAVNLGKESIQKFPDSKELKLDYLTLLCEEKTITRELCGSEIKRCLDLDGSIKEEARFQTLIKEYQITWGEGGAICVGR